MDDEEVSKNFFKLECPNSIWINDVTYEMSHRLLIMFMFYN